MAFTMDLHGPDLLLAASFALLGAGLGLVCAIGLTFWIAGAGPWRVDRDRTPKP